MDDHPDPEPRWQQTPWWYGKATRDHLLIGFCVMALLVTALIFVVVVWGM
jgi:hypothetical protein